MFQFIGIGERNAYLSFSFWRTGHLHLCGEERGQSVFQHIELLRKLGLGCYNLFCTREILAAVQLACYLLHLTHRVAVLLYFLEHLYLQRRRVNGEQRTCMSHVYLLLLQCHLHLCRKFQ